MSMFDGSSFSPELDSERLSSQLSRVKSFLLSHPNWFTLEEIAAATGTPLSTVSSRVRDLRKEKFGGYKIERKRIGESGLWVYKLEEKTQVLWDGNQMRFA